MSQDSTNRNIGGLTNDLAFAAHATDITRDEFKALFKQAIDTFELSTEELAKTYKTSPLTVQRWLSGVSAPHRLGRPSIFRVLHKIALERTLQEAIDQAERGETRPRPDKSRLEHLQNLPAEE